MASYEALAASYDELTEDVDYLRRADFIEKLFRRARLPVHTLLDLAEKGNRELQAAQRAALALD